MKGMTLHEISNAYIQVVEDDTYDDQSYNCALHDTWFRIVSSDQQMQIIQIVNSSLRIEVEMLKLQVKLNISFLVPAPSLYQQLNQ